jgi:hypothetical protein
MRALMMGLPAPAAAAAAAAAPAAAAAAAAAAPAAAAAAAAAAPAATYACPPALAGSSRLPVSAGAWQAVIVMMMMMMMMMMTMMTITTTTTTTTTTTIIIITIIMIINYFNNKIINGKKEVGESLALSLSRSLTRFSRARRPGGRFWAGMAGAAQDAGEWIGPLCAKGGRENGFQEGRENGRRGIAHPLSSRDFPFSHWVAACNEKGERMDDNGRDGLYGRRRAGRWGAAGGRCALQEA